MNGFTLLGILAFVYAGFVFFKTIKNQMQSGIWLKLRVLEKLLVKKE